jgi:sugar phosphate isomerase/epimerase
MQTRRDFIKGSGALALGAMALPSFAAKDNFVKNPGIQLYTFRKEMEADAIGTLKQLATLGIKQIESANSDKGAYYGLSPKEMKDTCKSLGMTLRSGHIHLDDKFDQTIRNAVEAGQEYLICSSMPTKGQTVSNYKTVAAAFNKAGEQAKKAGLKFGYHNHEYEFEAENGKVLYDVLLEETDPALVHMELDLGWVIIPGKDPLAYFDKYPGRFPLWHLKDMDMTKKHSTEFGKGGLDIQKMFNNAKKAGLKYYFIEQEEYTNTPLESMQQNMTYLKKIKG